MVPLQVCLVTISRNTKLNLIIPAATRPTTGARAEKQKSPKIIFVGECERLNPIEDSLGKMNAIMPWMAIERLLANSTQAVG